MESDEGETAVRYGLLDDGLGGFTTSGLTVGDRVRLTNQCQKPPFHPGETGRIVWVSRWGLYHVRMDGPKGSPLASFEPDEIEPVFQG